MKCILDTCVYIVYNLCLGKLEAAIDWQIEAWKSVDSLVNIIILLLFFLHLLTPSSSPSPQNIQSIQIKFLFRCPRWKSNPCLSQRLHAMTPQIQTGCSEAKSCISIDRSNLCRYERAGIIHLLYNAWCLKHVSPWQSLLWQRLLPEALLLLIQSSLSKAFNLFLFGKLSCLDISYVLLSLSSSSKWWDILFTNNFFFKHLYMPFHFCNRLVLNIYF